MIVALDIKFVNLYDPISIALYTPNDSLYCEIVYPESIPDKIHKYLWKIKTFTEISHKDINYYYDEQDAVNERVRKFITKYSSADYLILKDLRVWTYFNTILKDDEYNPIIFEYLYKYTFNIPLNNNSLDIQHLSRTMNRNKENALDTAEMLYLAYDNLFS